MQSPPSDPAPRFEAALSAAMRAHQAGDPAGAQAQYEALLADAPEHPTLRNFLGMAQIQQRQFAEGEANVRRALQADPVYAEAWNSLGNLYRLAGRPEEALAAYQAMTRLAPAAVAGWINLADLCQQMGNTAHGQAALATAAQLVQTQTGTPAAFRCRLLQSLAALQRAWGRWDEAAQLCALSLQLSPEDPRCRRELIDLLLRAGRTQDARREAQAWLAREPDSDMARHALACASGSGTPPRAADDEVRAIFDGHARAFDGQLADLGYRAPALLQHVVGTRLGPGRANLRVCDAGCGTGLCGPWLRGYAQGLEGVDLSQGMLDLAHERQLYDTLACAELTAWLGERTGRFDLLVGADVLCYFGELQTVLRAAQAALHDGGWLAFTVEHAPEPGPQGYQLQINGRYRHGAAYVRQCLQDAGFGDTLIAAADLRLEGGMPVQGLVVSAQRGTR